MCTIVTDFGTIRAGIQVVVAVMLESFGTARQLYREEEAREAALDSRLHFYSSHGRKTELPLDPVLEEITLGCESYEALQARLISFFEWSVAYQSAQFWFMIIESFDAKPEITAKKILWVIELT